MMESISERSYTKGNPSMEEIIAFIMSVEE